MNIRVCPCCKIEKELTLNNFTSNKQRSNGFSFYCKSCRSKTRGKEWQKYYKNDLEAIKRVRIRQWDNTNNTLAGKARTLVKAYKQRDNKKGQEFDLTNKWFIENILLSKCYYCESTSQLGADRIDNSKGHTISNIIPCCSVCNSVRSDIFTISEMQELGFKIKELRKNRNIKKVSGNKKDYSNEYQITISDEKVEHLV